jgi:hypothetical protein
MSLNAWICSGFTVVAIVFYVVFYVVWAWLSFGMKQVARDALSQIRNRDWP